MSYQRPNLDLQPEVDLEVEQIPAKRARFVSVADGDISEIIASRVPQTTKRATEGWMKVFADYCKAKDIAVDLKTVEAENLAAILSRFYLEVRWADGEPYQKASLLGLRAALHRHLRGLSRPFDIYKGVEFRRANEALDRQIKKLKKDGKLLPTRH